MTTAAAKPMEWMVPDRHQRAKVCGNAWKTGSDAHLVELDLCGTDHAGLEEIELSTEAVLHG